MSSLGKDARRSIRYANMPCPTIEPEADSVLCISNHAMDILRGIQVPEGKPGYDEICGFDNGWIMYLELRNLAVRDSRLKHVRDNCAAVIKVRGEKSTPPPHEEGIGVVRNLHQGFGIHPKHGAEIYDTFRTEANAVCGRMAVMGYGPMLSARPDILARSLVEGQGVADDPRQGALQWAAEQYEGMALGIVREMGTKKTRRIMSRYGIPPKYSLAVHHIFGDSALRLCGRIAYEGFAHKLKSNPEVLVKSYYEAIKLMPKHDPVESTFLVALMNYEKLAAMKNEPFVVPVKAETSWEVVGHDIGFEPGGKIFRLPREDYEAATEIDDDGEWAGVVPLFDEEGLLDDGLEEEDEAALEQPLHLHRYDENLEDRLLA